MPDPTVQSSRDRRPIGPGPSVCALVLAAALWSAGAWLTLDRPPQPLASVEVLSVAQQPDPLAELPECVVILNDGRVLEGLLVDRTRERVVVRINGIDTPVEARDVSRLRVLPPVRERYREMRAAVDDDDADGLVLIARWLRDRELYEEALVEIESALRADPSHPQARPLRTWLMNQIELQKKVIARPDAQNGAPDGDPAPVRRGEAGGFPLLTADEINLIRVYEIDLAAPPRMVIPRDTIERLMESYAGSVHIPATAAEREAFLRRRPAEILRVMYRLQARELYPQVRVLDDPRSIDLFRDRLHGRTGWLLNACASNRCHGGSEAGRLRLTTRRTNSDAAVYTNLYILEHFRMSDGTPLINYDNPERSPLLHLAMLRDNSLYPHPETGGTAGTRGWRPLFRSTDDRQFERAVEWIDAMYRPRPTWPIAYKPPAPLEPPPEDLDGVDR
ncbi:MAG: hypothetical protein AAF356_07965 [Planctomycetota bacterium]